MRLSHQVVAAATVVVAAAAMAAVAVVAVVAAATAAKTRALAPVTPAVTMGAAAALGRRRRRRSLEAVEAMGKGKETGRGYLPSRKHPLWATRLEASAVATARRTAARAKSTNRSMAAWVGWWVVDARAVAEAAGKV